MHVADVRRDWPQELANRSYERGGVSGGTHEQPPQPISLKWRRPCDRIASSIREASHREVFVHSNDRTTRLGAIQLHGAVLEVDALVQRIEARPHTFGKGSADHHLRRSPGPVVIRFEGAPAEHAKAHGLDEAISP